jgi:hypothetical protein
MLERCQQRSCVLIETIAPKGQPLQVVILAFILACQLDPLCHSCVICSMCLNAKDRLARVLIDVAAFRSLPGGVISAF